MKKYTVFIKSFAVVFLLGLVSCSENDPAAGSNGENELRIVPSIGDLVEAVTRASGNSFFKEGDEIRVVIQSSRVGTEPDSLIYIWYRRNFYR